MCASRNRLGWALALVLLLPSLAAAQATFLQSTTDATDTTAYTFTAQNLGTAAADRYIIVASAGRKSGTSQCSAPTMTIAGVSATAIVSRATNPTNCNIAAIYKALVPTGATGDIVVTYVGTMLRAHIAVYRSTGTQTVGSGTTGSSSADDPTGTLTIPAGGYAIGGSMTAITAATATWTGLTETLDEAMESSSATGALLTPGTTQTGITITADWSTALESTGVWAVWAVTSPGAGTQRTLMGCCE